MKALIRVANVRSNIKFNQVEAYRALTLSDVNILLERYSDIDMLIFEEVQPNEVIAVKKLAADFKGKTFTFGNIKLADIMNYTSLSDMQDAIDTMYSIHTRTYGRVRGPVLFKEVYDESGNLYVEQEEKEIKKETVLEETVLGEAVTQETVIQDEVAESSENITITSEGSDEIENDMFSDFGDAEIDVANPIVTVGEDANNSDEIENDMFSDFGDAEIDVANPIVTVGETVEENNNNLDIGETYTETETEGTNEEPITEISVDIKESAGNDMFVDLPDTKVETDEIVEKTEIEGITELSNDRLSSDVSNTSETKIEEVREEQKFSLNKTEDSTSEPVVTKKEVSGEFRAIQIDAVLDLARLDSFNSLLQNSKDLVSTMYSELCYYREAIANLSKEESVQLIVEGSKGKVDTTLLDKANETIKDLEYRLKEVQVKDEEIRNLESQISSIKVQYDTLKSKYAVSEKRNQELTNSLNELQTRSSNKLSTLQNELLTKKESLEGELSTANAEIERLNQQISTYVKAASSDREKMSQSSKEVQSIYSNYLATLTAISTLTQKYTRLVDAHNQEITKVKTLGATYQKVLQEKVDLEAKITELELQGRMNENKLAENDRVTSLKLSEFSKMQESLKSQLDEANSKCTTLGLEIDSLNARVSAADKQKQAALTQVDNLLDEISNKNTILDSKETMISQLQSELTQLKEDKAEAHQLQEQVQVSDMASQNLQKEIGLLQIEIKNMQDELDEKNKKIGSLARANSELKLSSQALAQSTKTNTAVALNCRYSGHAFIYPIFGSGSYGVTTTAVSLAKKLHADGNSVLLMDLDLVAPKCNGYLKQPPLLPQEIGMNAGIQDKMAHTCMGILMHKGVDYFIHERSSLITQIALNKRTRKPLDFFSGLYANMEVYKFISIDWTELLNTLGNYYDMIVVDLGRFGGNAEQNSLIKMFYTICFKFLVVTTKQDDDARMMKLKLSTNRMDIAKGVWMLNMANNTTLSPLLQKITMNTHYGIVTFNSGMYGTTNLFTDAVFKGQFTAIADMLTAT